MNSPDKLTTAREIAMLYVIFLGSDYDKGKEGAVECPIRKWFAREKRVNKHRDLLEEVIGRGDKHVRLITCKKTSDIERYRI